MRPITAVKRGALFTAALLALSGTVRAQNYDEGAGRTSPGSDAESGQFEGSPPAPARTNPAPPPAQYSTVRPLSLEELRGINQQGRSNEEQLRQISDNLSTINALIAAGERGDILHTTSGDIIALPVTSAVHHIIDETRFRYSHAQLLELMARLRRDSVELLKSLRAYRLNMWRQRDSILRALDADRRRVMADANRPGNAYTPAATSGPPPEIAARVVSGPVTLVWKECWGPPHGTGPCSVRDNPIYEYTLNDGSIWGDRREYDRNRAQWAAAGLVFHSSPLAPERR